MGPHRLTPRPAAADASTAFVTDGADRGAPPTPPLRVHQPELAEAARVAAEVMPPEDPLLLSQLIGRGAEAALVTGEALYCYLDAEQTIAAGRVGDVPSDVVRPHVRKVACAEHFLAHVAVPLHHVCLLMWDVCERKRSRN